MSDCHATGMFDSDTVNSSGWLVGDESLKVVPQWEVLKTGAACVVQGSMQGAMAKVAEANAVLNERLGRLPTHEEIGNMVGICEKRVRVICERSRAPLSLDQPMSDRGSITIKVPFSLPLQSKNISSHTWVLILVLVFYCRKYFQGRTD